MLAVLQLEQRGHDQRCSHKGYLCMFANMRSLVYVASWCTRSGWRTAMQLSRDMQ